MSQRKCGTCRHFEEGGIASSGWCRHPLRQDIQTMVLVRKSELACRNGWEEDLWEPRERNVQPRPISTPSEPVRISATAEPQRSEQEQQYTDRVTTVAVVSSAPIRSADSAPQPRAARAGVQFDDDAAFDASTEAPGTQQREIRTGEPPRQGQARIESPARPAPGIETTRRDNIPLNTRSWDTPRPSLPPSSNRVNPPPQRTSPLRQEAAVESPPRPPVQRRPEVTAWGQPSPVRTDPQPETRISPPAQRQTQRDRRPLDTSPVPRASHEQLRRESLAPPTQSGSTEPFASVQAKPAAAEPHAAPVEALVVEEQRAEPPAALSPTLAQIPQCCASCRDFRPAEGGDRGWCNNKYAFEHRQMVRRDDLACRSSIGNWWAPSDDWWLTRADITHHGRPTPTVDEMLQRLLEARNGARRRVARS